MVDANCNIIVTVGFLLSDDTLAAAKKNPDIKFAIVDNNDPKTYPAVKNLKPLVFNTAQSSFMAGYLAAGMTKTKKVGTFGGAKIPTVTIFMDGFAQGVRVLQQAEERHGPGARLGRGQAGRPVRARRQAVRGRQSGGQRTAQGLISQGADIIFPVAGPAGEGALQAAKASGGKVNAIWVDTDGCVSAETYCPQHHLQRLQGPWTSRCSTRSRRPRTARFSNEPFVGTLENDGTGLSPFHDFDSKVPAELKTELDTIKADIISGKIKIESKSQPSSGVTGRASMSCRAEGRPDRQPPLTAGCVDRSAAAGDHQAVRVAGGQRRASTWTSCPARSTACSARTGPASRR